jgi:hypothetical protein
MSAVGHRVKPLCRSCHFLEVYSGKMAGETMSLERCRQGVPGELNKRECQAYQREPGSDDE